MPPASPQPIGDPLHAVYEDNVTVLAQYYGVPSLSVRNAFFPLVVNKVRDVLHDWCCVMSDTSGRMQVELCSEDTASANPACVLCPVALPTATTLPLKGKGCLIGSAYLKRDNELSGTRASPRLTWESVHPNGLQCA